MKTLGLLLLLTFSSLSFAQVGIGTVTPDQSSVLDVTSTTQGFLPPRLTTLQRDAIVTPAEGLTIYNTTVHCLETYNGTNWYNYCTGSIVARCGYNDTAIVEVTSATGRIWMDRNIGASQVATSSTECRCLWSLIPMG